MTAQQKDDWQKPRAKWQHLTEAEIARIRIAYQQRRKNRDIARELQCSTRVVQKYYAQFADQGIPQQREPAPARPRFYKGNFEL